MEKIKCERCDTENIGSSKYCSGCGYELPRPIEKDVTIQNMNSQPKGLGRGVNINLRAIIGAVVGVCIAIGVQQWLFKTPSFDKVMVASMNEINKTCPLMVDAETRLDNTLVIPPKTFQYNYTVLSAEAGLVDTIEVKKRIEPTILSFVKTNPQLKVMRDNNTTLNYYYKDKNGIYLFIITVKPEQYK